MIKSEVITVNNVETNEYFFARYHSDYGLGDNWVPITSYLPMSIAPRPGFEDGVVETLEDYVKVFHEGEKEIPHPYPELDEGPYDCIKFYKDLAAIQFNRKEESP